MEYRKTIILKDGRECTIRNATEKDGQAALEVFILTHEQTDFLFTYPDENDQTAEQEAQRLKEKTESENEIDILAEIDGKVVGLAGIDSIGTQEKIRHRAEFGISIDKDYWGLGIGRAMTKACIECAQKAGYLQLELTVVADNNKAIALYESEGFVEYGRNPRAYHLRSSNFQELLMMRLELNN